MRKSFLIFVMTSLLLSLCNTVSAQQPNSPVDIAASAKTVADSVAQITLPVSLPEGETIESFLLKHDVYKDEEGNYISQFFGEKKKMITKDVEFWLVYWAVKDSISRSQQQASSQEVKAVTAKMDGKGSRPLTPEEMREYGLIGIPIPLPEGETVESYLLKQPGVHKDEEGNIIYPNGRKQTPEDIKQIERFTHISIKDSLLKYQQKYQQQNK